MKIKSLKVILIGVGILIGIGIMTLLTVDSVSENEKISDNSQVVEKAALAALVLLPDGTFVKADSSDPRVYLIENGYKRWIDSGETYRTQGFPWDKISSIPVEQLAAIPEGPIITAQSEIILPAEVEVIPDLAPFPAQEVRLSTVNGRTVLRFTSSFWNKGRGRFELIAGPQQTDFNRDGYVDTFQKLVRPDGTIRQKAVGNFLWHEVHQHYHYDEFADYVLKMVKPEPQALDFGSPAITQKTTFCMRDDRAIDLSLAGAPQVKYYSLCQKDRQGVSVGWADRYGWDLPDQYIDINDLPSGIYTLTFNVDPRRRFIEVSKENNISIAIIEFNVAAKTMRVLATGASFNTSQNKYPDGMLLRAQGDNGIYIIKDNKKRQLKTNEIFDSYGLSMSQVYDLPASVMEFIPNTRLVKQVGSGEIFVLNDAGYRRKILNPDVLKSYGWAPTDVVEVNAPEFASYPETQLIRRSSEGQVYSIVTKKFVGDINSLRDLGYDPLSVHTVNDIDFDAYTIKILARNLTVPWDVVFLPGGDMLVTERPGTIKRIGTRNVTISLPSVLHVGEGGLMGIALHPQFSANNYIYLYFTTDAEGGRSNRVSRFRLDGDRLVDERVILSGIPAALYHDGGQISFGPDGMLYITTGDAEVPNLAQDLNSLAGKTLRLTAEGQIPADNPFGTAVWSYGHRNAQGIAWDAQGRMWQTEHGRSGALSGFDELNMVERGKNYGWPIIQGDEERSGMVRPIRHSGASTTWAPSGIAFISGNLYFSGLKGTSLYRVTINETGGVEEFKTFYSGKFGRLRASVAGPDGLLYVTTSNRDGRGIPAIDDDKIIKIAPDFIR